MELVRWHGRWCVDLASVPAFGFTKERKVVIVAIVC